MTKPLRIGLIMQGSRDWIGGAEYIKNLILALGSVPEEVRSTFELYLICSKSIDAELHSQISSTVDRTYYLEVDLEPASLINRIRWKLIKTLLDLPDPRLNAFIKKINLDFIYPNLNQGKAKTACPSAAWIPDFQYKYLTQFFTKLERQKREQACQKIAKYAEVVVLSSQTATADFKKFYPQAAHKTRILSFKTSCLPQWYEADPVATQAKYNLSDRFFLVSNQFWQHKNHLLIFAALKILQEKSIYPIVVCTGLLYDHRQPEYGNTITQTIENLGIQQQIHLLSLIPKIDQIQLMRRCLAVIQPSFFEGWSTVVEDARTFGKSIILSDIPVHLEQNPPNSTFFERHSSESLATILANSWQSFNPGPNLEQEAIAKTNNALEIQNFGYNFLEITKGVCERKNLP